MTKEEFLKQSNEFLSEIRQSFADEVLENGKPALEKAANIPNTREALTQLTVELTHIVSTASFEASCSYSEKLASLLFDQR